MKIVKKFTCPDNKSHDTFFQEGIWLFKDGLFEAEGPIKCGECGALAQEKRYPSYRNEFLKMTALEREVILEEFQTKSGEEVRKVLLPSLEVETRSARRTQTVGHYDPDLDRIILNK